MSISDKSFLIVSKNDDFADLMRGALSTDLAELATENTSFTAMNGKALDLADRFDVIIFDADPDDAGEVEALKAVIEKRGKDKLFVAITDADLTIAKAQALHDAGVDEVLPNTIQPEGLRRAVDALITRKVITPVGHAAGPESEGKVIAVMQARGGVGATNTAVNIACGLARKKGRKIPRARVALVDLDLQFGNANVFLDLEDNGGFIDMVRAAVPPDAHFVETVMQSHDSGIDLLSAPEKIAPLDIVPPEYIRKLLEILTARYDHVVLDMPHALVDWIAPVIGRADLVVMVSDTSVPCVRRARRLIDFLHEDNVGLPVEVVINREKKPMIRSTQIREAEKVLETRFNEWIPDNPKIARVAADLGQPVVVSHPRSDIGKAYGRLVGSIETKLAEIRQTAN